jgi:hypothetical protein
VDDAAAVVAVAELHDARRLNSPPLLDTIAALRCVRGVVAGSLWLGTDGRTDDGSAAPCAVGFLRVGTVFIKIRVRVVWAGEVNGTVHGTWGIRSIPRPRGTRLGLLGASTRFGRVRRGGGRIRSSGARLVDTCCAAARGRGHGGEQSSAGLTAGRFALCGSSDFLLPRIFGWTLRPCLVT